LDGSLSLHGSDSVGDILGHNVSSVHQAAGHVLSVSWIAFGHHVGRLKDSVGELSNGELLVDSLLCAQDGSVRAQHKVDSWIGNQVSLELVDVHIQRSLESQRGSQGRDELSDQSVEVFVGGLLNSESLSADVVDSFVVKHESDISVLQKRVSGENRVVGLDHSSGHLRRWVDTEIELAFLSIVHRKSFQEELDPNPDPVPPPTEWKIKNPCNPEQLSTILRILSMEESTSSFPTV
jgi:hypothetical protein